MNIPNIGKSSLAILLFGLLMIILTSFSMNLNGQTSQHTVALSWIDTSNPTGTLYNVYRATGLCSGTPSFTKVASAVAVLKYVDSTVVPGNYCYQVTATSNGVESSPSNSALAPVPSFAPTQLNLVVQ